MSLYVSLFINHVFPDKILDVSSYKTNSRGPPLPKTRVVGDMKMPRGQPVRQVKCTVRNFNSKFNYILGIFDETRHLISDNY